MMTSMRIVLSNLKRTLECIYYDQSNKKVLPKGYVVIREFLTAKQINQLEMIYSFDRQDRKMNSDGADRRAVFYDTKAIMEMIMPNPMAKKIFKEYLPAHRHPTFVMRNILINTAMAGSGGGWHRDSYTPTLKIFVPLTTCTKGNGATIFIDQSQKFESKITDFFKGPRFHDVDIPLGSATQLLLNPGDIVIADTSCLHRGGVASITGRDMLTIYYSNPSLI